MTIDERVAEILQQLGAVPVKDASLEALLRRHFMEAIIEEHNAVVLAMQAQYEDISS